MKTSKIIFSFAALLTISCVIDNDVNYPLNYCLDGQGAVVTETRTLSEFHSIANSIYADVYLTQGPKEDIRIEAQSNILRELETHVINGELRLNFDHCVDIYQPVQVYITNPEFRNLRLAGVGDFVVENEFDLVNLTISLTGVGDFIMHGTTSNLDILVSGVGNVRAFDFTSNVCDVRISGVGDVEVFVDNELNVNISGTGTVFYKGQPAVSTVITGSGSVVNSN